MAGILKPTVANLGYEASIYMLSSKLTEGTASKLIDGNGTDVVRFATGDFVEIEIRRKCNLWRSGTSTQSAKNGQLKIFKYDVTTSAYVEVTATYNVATTVITNTAWEKFAQNLPIGRYKFQFNTAERADSEWYAEIITPVNVVAITQTGEVKTFDSTNNWSVISGVTKDTLTPSVITTQGIPYGLLSKQLNVMYTNMVLSTTYATGEELWISDEISKDLGVTAMDLDESGTSPRIALTVPPYLPKDRLASTDILYAYCADTDFAPDIMNVSISANVIHSENITITLDTLYNYNEKIKFRLKLNDGTWGNWSQLYSPWEKPSMTIQASSLKVGQNSFTIELTNETQTRTTTQLMVNAITLNNDAPQIALVSADSNSFKVHFMITDPNMGDLVQYRILITNSKKSNEVVLPWTTLITGPLDITYYIDTTNVVIGSTNILTIEYRDNYGTTGSTNYVFTGQYKNILFADEHGEYYTTDKGAILKLLDFGTVVAGTITEGVPIRLVNKYGSPVTHIKVNSVIITDAGVKYELSKSNNPFRPLDALDFGDSIVGVDGQLDFYVRANINDTAVGIGEFELDVTADS